MHVMLSLKPTKKDFRYRKVTGNSLCNLRQRDRKNIRVFFHDLQGYDSRLFVTDLANTLGGVKCILCNKKHYITFNKFVKVRERESYETSKITGLKELKLRHIWYNLRFLDSFKFLPNSPEKLVKNVDKEKLKYTEMHFNDERVHLMLQKVFPLRIP